MLSFVLALAVAAQSDATTSTRQAYSACLREHLDTSLEGNVAPDRFEATIAGQCTGQATAFRDALIQRDVRGGGNRARAEEDAGVIMEDMRVNYVERYRDEVDAATPPPPPEPEPEPPAEEPQPETPETPE